MNPNTLLDIEILWLYNEKAKRESLLSHTMRTQEDIDNLVKFVELITDKKRADRRARIGYQLIEQFCLNTRLPICTSKLFKQT